MTGVTPKRTLLLLFSFGVNLGPGGRACCCCFSPLGSMEGYQVLGTKSLVPGTWYQVLGTKYLVPGTWYQAGQALLLCVGGLEPPGASRCCCFFMGGSNQARVFVVVIYLGVVTFSSESPLLLFSFHG